jgi:hypothetical protein
MSLHITHLRKGCELLHNNFKTYLKTFKLVMRILSNEQLKPLRY